MSPVVAILIKLAVRLVVFTGVFFLAAKKHPKIIFEKTKWTAPLIGLVFVILNTALYWILKPVLNLATLGVLSLAMPLVINGALLALTMKIFEKKPQWFRIEGFIPAFVLALILTAAHGVLWFSVDYVPAKI